MLVILGSKPSNDFGLANDFLFLTARTRLDTQESASCWVCGDENWGHHLAPPAHLLGFGVPKPFVSDFSKTKAI